MRVSQMIALLTGATGGIGRAIAEELLNHGASVFMVGRDEQALTSAALDLIQHKDRVTTCNADITVPAQRKQLCQLALNWRGGVNTLINSAGICDFGLLADQEAACIETAFAVNVQAPMHLSQLLLPQLQRAPAAAIINIGSVFGAIGYPGYAAYCASKFALRGFTEALRRELEGSSVRMHYLAPRATRTSMNSSAVDNMNAELRVAVDPPQRVARELRLMVEQEQSSLVVGSPESFFTKVNALAPGIVDKFIHQKLPVIQRYARENTAAVRSPKPMRSISPSLKRNAL
jgi:short-subunit dehydrogenase